MSGLLGKSNIGGGGTGKAFAAITVTYPVGSICTCSNGQKTLKAKDTSGSFLFLVPSGGEWTVSCTDGESTSTQTVNINQFDTLNIELTYSYYIYRNGIIDNMTPTITRVDGGSTMGSLTINANDFYINSVGPHYGRTYFDNFDPAILANYTKFNIRFSEATPYSSDHIITMCIEPNPTSYSTERIATQTVNAISGVATLQFNKGITAHPVIETLRSGIRITEAWLS